MSSMRVECGTRTQERKKMAGRCSSCSEDDAGDARGDVQYVPGVTARVQLGDSTSANSCVVDKHSDP